MTETPPPPSPEPAPRPDPGAPPTDTLTAAGPEPASTSTGTGTGPRVTRDEVRDLGRLRRTTGTERTFAGVAGGLGRHLDVDPVVVRVALVVLVFFGGAGLLLYLALWLVLPADDSPTAPLGLDERSRTLAVLVVGGIAALVVLSSGLGGSFLPLPVVVVATLLALLVVQVGRRRQAPPPPAAPGTPWAAPTTAPVTSPVTSPVAAPVTSPTPWTHPVQAAPTTPRWAPPPAPRKPGPVLFWFVLAAAALGLGLLATLDAAGAGIPGSAYPALVVGVVGVALVGGSVWGRPGGLVAVGLVATLGLVGSVAAEQVDADDLVVRPTTAADLRPEYALDAGTLVLDLRDVADLDALAGREVDVDLGAGLLDVRVPPGLALEVRAEVTGPGGVELPDGSSWGIGTSTSASIEGTGATGATGDPLVLDLNADAGGIQVRDDLTTTTVGSPR